MYYVIISFTVIVSIISEVFYRMPVSPPPTREGSDGESGRGSPLDSGTDNASVQQIPAGGNVSGGVSAGVTIGSPAIESRGASPSAVLAGGSGGSGQRLSWTPSEIHRRRRESRESDDYGYTNDGFTHPGGSPIPPGIYDPHSPSTYPGLLNRRASALTVIPPMLVR